MKRILLQLDTDPQPSSFDAVVALDAGADVLLPYGNVTPETVTGLVHGAMFTRGGEDLGQTAIFVGGGDVQAGEDLYEKVRETFFGPVRVSVMLDSNGSNTTASAAVLCAEQHLNLSSTVTAVLGGTGPVGRRIAELVALQGGTVLVCSRVLERAKSVCDKISAAIDNETARLEPLETDPESLAKLGDRCQLIFAAGAAGAELLPESLWQTAQTTQILIDVNAVPPVGIGGIDVMDAATERHGKICYGAIGVGGLKMRIHKACISQLFASNSAELNTRSIYHIGQNLQNT